MTTLIEFAIIGLATGGLYAMLGLGIIVVYRSSNVINFSNAAVGLVAAFVLFDLHSHNVPTVVAVVCALLTGPVLNVAVYGLVMRPLVNASPLTRGIATLGVLVILQSALTLRYGSSPDNGFQFFPNGASLHIVGAVVSSASVVILFGSVVLVAILTVVYKRTRFGLATSALAENGFLFKTLGGSTDRVALINWAAAGALAAVAGILIAPITQLAPGLGTTLLLPALAVALAGGLASFPLALVGGLGIGVIQAELTNYSSGTGFLSHFPGLSEALPFLVVIPIVALRGRALPTRDFVSTKLPRVGSGVASIPVILVAVAIMATLLATLSLPWVLAIVDGFAVGALLLSVIVLTGYAGQLSLAQVSLAGVSVLVASRLIADLGVPMILASIIGLLAVIPVGILIGLPSLRTRGIAFAVITLGFADTLNAMVFNNSTLTQSLTGMNIGDAKVFGWDVNPIDHPRSYAYVALAIVTILALIVSNLRRSSIGRTLLAVRGNEQAAASLGIAVRAAKLYAFSLSAVIAGCGGMLLAFQTSTVTFNNYDPFTSVNSVTEATFGGVGFISGAWVGTGLEPAGVGGRVTTLLGLGSWLPLFGGVLLVATIVLNPNGVVDIMIRQAAWVRGQAHRLLPSTLRYSRRGNQPRASAEVVPTIGTRRDVLSRNGDLGPPLLRVADLRVTFGGIVAVDDLSFECASGQVLGVIGPNGAGKTSLIDAVTGYVPCSGKILLGERELGQCSPTERARAGVTRSFQSLELFDDLTVEENLSVAAGRSSWWRWLTCLVWPGNATWNPAVEEAVSEFGLSQVMDRTPSELPYGQRRLLAITRALATNPQVLLLDEPASGLDNRDRVELARLVRWLADFQNMAIVFVEHDVELVMELSDRVLAINFGSRIAYGEPTEVREHPEVITAYLGEEVKPGEVNELIREAENPREMPSVVGEP